MDLNRTQITVSPVKREPKDMLKVIEIAKYVIQEAMENFVFPDEIKTKLMK